MKDANLKNKILENGYIPFNINCIDEEIISDSILILDDGSYFLGKSFGSKKNKHW